MKNTLKQFSGLIGTGFTAACCLGLPLVLSAVGAVGLSFIINDAYLMPLFAAFVTFTLWQLYHSSKQHGDLRPFYLSALSGLSSIVIMMLLVTGIYPATTLLSIALVGLVAGSVWDVINGRHKKTQASWHIEKEPLDLKRRKVNGAGLAVAAAGVFFGMYKTVDAIAPSASKNDIKCWGGNSCKGKSACGSALNSCTAQNSCKGKGWSFMPEKACYINGGVKFEGSEGDPLAKSS